MNREGVMVVTVFDSAVRFCVPVLAVWNVGNDWYVCVNESVVPWIVPLPDTVFESMSYTRDLFFIRMESEESSVPYVAV